MRRAVVRERCCRRWSTACTAQAPAPNQSGERVVRRPVQIPLVGLRGVRGTPQPYPKHCRDRRWDPRCAGVGYPVSRDGPMGLGAAHLLGDGTSNHKTRAGGGGGGGPVEFAGSPTIEFAAATDASIHRRRPGPRVRLQASRGTAHQGEHSGPIQPLAALTTQAKPTAPGNLVSHHQGAAVRGPPPLLGDGGVAGGVGRTCPQTQSHTLSVDACC